MPQPDYTRLLDKSSLDDFLALRDNRRIVVAVSGGADSVGMLLALNSYARRGNLILTVAHFNHQTRQGCKEDQEFVSDLADRLSVPIKIGIADGTKKSGGMSPEEFWRQQRYAFFQGVVEETGRGMLALGHTADDLAETFLYHLARGTSSAGIDFRFNQMTDQFEILRPLWKTTRIQIEDLLISAGEQWRKDPSNFDLRYARNRIRHEVMPALQKINPRASEAILRFVEQFQASQIPVKLPDVSATMPREAFESLSYQEILKALAAYIRNNSRSRPERSQLEQVGKLIMNTKTGLVSLHGKCTVVVDQQEVWLYPGDQPTDLELATFYAESRNLRLADIKDARKVDELPIVITGLGAEFQITSEDLIAGRIVVIRNPVEGDKYRGKALKRVFMDQKIPWFIRDYIMILENANHEIVGWIL